MGLIRVSFKDKEAQLLNDILNECDVIGQSHWMKLAAIEKLQRDKEKVNISQNVNSNSNSNLNNIQNSYVKSNVINSLDQLFKD